MFQDSDLGTNTEPPLYSKISQLVLLQNLKSNFFYGIAPQYWKRKGIQGPRVLFPWGNNPGADKEFIFNEESFHGSVRRLYEEMKGERYYGTYTPVTAMPILHLRDLDLMQHIMGKLT